MNSQVITIGERTYLFHCEAVGNDFVTGVSQTRQLFITWNIFDGRIPLLLGKEPSFLVKMLYAKFVNEAYISETDLMSLQEPNKGTQGFPVLKFISWFLPVALFVAMLIASYFMNELKMGIFLAVFIPAALYLALSSLLNTVRISESRHRIALQVLDRMRSRFGGHDLAHLEAWLSDIVSIRVGGRETEEIVKGARLCLQILRSGE